VLGILAANENKEKPNMRPLPPIIITELDLERLGRVLESHEGSSVERLDEELARARVVPKEAISPNVVTMNSQVTFQDCATGAKRTIQLVYPGAAAPGEGKVSILSPMGSALLGMQVGQVIEWKTPSGSFEVRVLEVPYQPEAAGDYAL